MVLEGEGIIKTGWESPEMLQKVGGREWNKYPEMGSNMEWNTAKQKKLSQIGRNAARHWEMVQYPIKWRE